MATTKKTTIIESDEPIVEAQPVQTVATAQPATVAKEGLSRQGIITVSIVSAVILFFLGTGLGYLLGNQGSNKRSNMMQNTQTYPRDGMMQRGTSGRNSTQTAPNQGTTNNGTQQTTPQTQSN